MFQSRNKALTMLFLIWALMRTSSVAETPRRASDILSVCSVIENLRGYRGKLITVRGELVRTEEGSYLRATWCRPLLVEGYIWPPESVRISLIPPSSPEVEEPKQPLPSVHVDPRSAHTLTRKVRDEDACILETVTGRLETRVHFESVLWGNGKRMPYGYGHLNLSPAQLVYTRIEDVEVKHCPQREPSVMK